MNPATFSPAHFGWAFADGVATVTLNRPERKNSLTFDSYAELRDAFRAFAYADVVKLATEWAVSIDTAIEMEAQAQAICMATRDFRRAFDAFADKRLSIFEGN